MGNNIDIRLPNITAATPDGQMKQMQSYMHQLVQQLNWALNTIDEAVAGNTSSVVMSKQSEAISPGEAADTFNSIKSLIIKSADIVKAYEETMRRDFNGEYVAISDFGTYTEKTSATILKSSKSVTELYTRVETINKDISSTNAYIKRGYLGKYKNGDLKDEEAFGYGVGETDESGIFNQYAWFTSKRLSFFDNGGNEVAYISQSKLNITDAVFNGTVQFGGYKLDTSDGLAFTWVEG